MNCMQLAKINHAISSNGRLLDALVHPSKIPNFAVTPALSSITLMAGKVPEILSRDSGVVFCSIWRIVPSLSTNSMSSDIKVFFIHIEINFASPKLKSMPWLGLICCRNISPSCRWEGVVAISTMNLWSPDREMITISDCGKLTSDSTFEASRANKHPNKQRRLMPFLIMFQVPCRYSPCRVT